MTGTGGNDDDFVNKALGSTPIRRLGPSPEAGPEPVATPEAGTADYSPVQGAMRTAAAKVLPLRKDDEPLPLRTWDEIADTVPPDANELERLTYIPGVVGDAVDWIVGAARRPNRMMALGTALTVVGTLVGRYIMGPTDSATHLYIVNLAPSGYGKDWPLVAGGKLLDSVGQSALLGPHEFASGPGTTKRISRNPLFVMYIDELGDELHKINTQGGNNYLAQLIGVLKKAYNAWGTIETSEKVDTQQVRIDWPAVSILGAATPEKFFANLLPGDFESGFANRFMIFPFEGYARPAEHAPAKGADEVPAELIAMLKRLPRAPVNKLGALTVTNGTDLAVGRRPTRHRLEWGEGAEAVYMAYSREQDALETTDKERYVLSMRACENAVRIATIIAVARGSAVVDVPDIECGFALAWRSIDAAIGGAAKYMQRYVEFPKLCDLVLDYIRTAGGWAPKRDIASAFRPYQRKGFEIKIVLDQLTAEERIARHPRRIGERGTTTEGYALTEATT